MPILHAKITFNVVKSKNDRNFFLSFFHFIRKRKKRDDDDLLLLRHIRETCAHKQSKHKIQYVCDILCKATVNDVQQS